MKTYTLVLYGLGYSALGLTIRARTYDRAERCAELLAARFGAAGGWSLYPY